MANYPELSNEDMEKAANIYIHRERENPMIYEIFNCIDGATHGYRFGEDATRKTLDRLPGLYVHDKSGKAYSFDFLPAASGFYVLDMRNAIKAGPFATRTDAERKSDFENQSSDTNSFHVYEQKN